MTQSDIQNLLRVQRENPDAVQAFADGELQECMCIIAGQQIVWDDKTYTDFSRKSDCYRRRPKQGVPRDIWFLETGEQVHCTKTAYFTTTKPNNHRYKHFREVL